MNPLQAFQLKCAIKIAEALFKKQYEVSKKKVEDAKTDNNSGDIDKLSGDRV